MRGSRPCRLRAASALEDDDRFSQRYLARRREEGACVAHRLHVDEDALRPPIVVEVVDHVAPPDVQQGPQGDEGAEADVFLKAPVEDGGLQRAALAEEGDLAFAGHRPRERRVQAGEGGHDPEAVRPDDAHPSGASDLEDLPLQPQSFSPTLPETGGDDDRAADSGLDTLADHARHHRRRCGHDREIDLLRSRAHAWPSLDPQHVGALRVDGEDGPPEGVGNQVAEDRAAYGAFLLAGPNHGHAARGEKDFQGMPRLTTGQIRRWIAWAHVAPTWCTTHASGRPRTFCAAGKNAAAERLIANAALYLATSPCGPMRVARPVHDWRWRCIAQPGECAFWSSRTSPL